MSRPLKIGLTGGIGSGKSTVSSMFARLGIPVIDADVISRELTTGRSPLVQILVDQFGTDIADQTGLINRQALRNRIFSDELARKQLESILHPLIFSRMEEIYATLDAPYCIFSIPLLLESDARTKVDRILVVDTPVALQIERTCIRDKVSATNVENILRTQLTREERLKAADDVIVNDSSIDNLQLQVNRLNTLYLKLVKNPVIV
jgi:dephospho-CoA kinase